MTVAPLATVAPVPGIRSLVIKVAGAGASLLIDTSGATLAFPLTTTPFTASPAGAELSGAGALMVAQLLVA